MCLSMDNGGKISANHYPMKSSKIGWNESLIIKLYFLFIENKINSINNIFFIN